MQEVISTVFYCGTIARKIGSQNQSLFSFILWKTALSRETKWNRMFGKVVEGLWCFQIVFITLTWIRACFTFFTLLQSVVLLGRVLENILYFGCFVGFEIICTIQKMWKTLMAECNFTKCSTPPLVFFAFLILYKSYQNAQRVTISSQTDTRKSAFNK